MKNILRKIIFTLWIALGVFSPAFAFAQNVKLDYSGFVKCDGVPAREIQVDQKTGASRDVGAKAGEEARQTECNFAALFDTIIKGVNWLFYISIPIATALVAYAGFLYITGVPGNINKARSIFTSVAIGFIIMFTAWFAVRQFVNWFVKPSSGAGTFISQ